MSADHISQPINDNHRFHACSAIIRSLDPLYYRFKLQSRELYPQLTIAIENIENFSVVDPAVPVPQRLLGGWGSHIKTVKTNCGGIHG